VHLVWEKSPILFPQLAAAGHAAGSNSHTLFWSQAEDKFKQVDSDVQGLTDWTTTKEEVRQASNLWMNLHNSNSQNNRNK